MTRTGNPYEHGLDKRPANFVPLSPLSFLERSAMVYPDKTAVVHGERRYMYTELYARCRRLGGALAARGVGYRGHRVADGAERPGDAGSPLRRADVRRGAQRAELPARRRHDPVHPRSRRDEGAHHRPGVLTGGGPGARRHGRAAHS